MRPASLARFTLATLALAGPAFTQGWNVKLVFDATAHGLAIDPFVAINDSGWIAFTSSGISNNAPYVFRGGTALQVGPNFSNRQYFGAALNDATPPQMASRDRETGAPALFRMRAWNADGSLFNALIGHSTADFDSASGWCDINDQGLVAFTALINGSSQTALMAGTQEPPTTLATYSGNQALRPQLSEHSEIVIRDPSGAVVVWTYPFGGPEFIAGSSGGFAAIGNWPGISRDGAAVAFAGDRGNGEGVFVSIVAPSGRVLVPLVGDGSGDGFTDIDDAQRIGVFTYGAAGSQLTSRAVFVGTRGGVTSLFSCSVIAIYSGGTVTTQVVGPQKILDYGASVGGKIVAGLNLYHPVNRHGVIAMYAGFTDGSQGILRAVGDSDGDGLLDLWEIVGIDGDGDGDADLDLLALGANPMHKDVFVEVDAVSGRMITPFAEQLVESFFDVAPVTNPDGIDGVKLFIQLDESDLTPAVWPTATVDSWPAAFDTHKTARFGTQSEQGDANWPAIRAAKQLAFHYCICADTMSPNDAAGLGELDGNDFMLVLGGFTPAGGSDHDQAVCFMHELGHNLGLRHGGGDDINFKPNYPSVMNYFWCFVTAANANGWTLRFSDTVYPTLEEGALLETEGIGARANVTTAVGPPPGTVVPESGPVDFNANGFLDVFAVAHDLTHVRPTDPPSPGEILVGYDDWSNLKFAFQDSAGFADADHPLVPGEITNAIVAELRSLEPAPGLYCTPKINSLGCTPSLGWSGTPSLSGPDDFFISASSVRNKKFGLLVWSRTPDTAPFLGGTLCVASPMLRKPVLSSGGSASGDDCSGAYSTHFDQTYMLQKGLFAGDVVCAQFWSRDPSAQDPQGVGLTGAISFLIAP